MKRLVARRLLHVDLSRRLELEGIGISFKGASLASSGGNMLLREDRWMNRFRNPLPKLIRCWGRIPLPFIMVLKPTNEATT